MIAKIKVIPAMMALAILTLLLGACSTGQAANGSAPAPSDGQQVSQQQQDERIVRPEGWTEETHSNDAAPNYDMVFPQDKVNQIKITVAPEDWEPMQANITELLGEQGSGQQGGRPGGRGFPDGGGFPQGTPPVEGVLPDGEGFPPQGFPDRFPEGEAPDGQGFPGGGGFGGPGGSGTSENPMWVPATIEFEGQTWTNVGVRYKGNSSLLDAWRSGSQKLPLKLDFDEFEDEFPEIDNQRFYGFKQLSFANSAVDDSYMRDTITYELLEDAGLVAAETAYYEVLLDYGEGEVSLGLYVVIEVIDDTVIDRHFGDDSGNIYEGDGPAASLAEGTNSQIETSFLKENNESGGDWDDIEALYDVLHSPQRTADPEAWQESLESVFDVDVFLKWLALSAAIQHWDTYGAMTHNFYLYNDPATGQLTWISWDHDRVLDGSGGDMGRGPGRFGRSSLDKQDVASNWPLIHYLMDDPVYQTRYLDYLEQVSNEVFDPVSLAARYQEIAALIAPYAANEIGADQFDTAVEQLTSQTYARAQEVADFLAGGGA